MERSLCKPLSRPLCPLLRVKSEKVGEWSESNHAKEQQRRPALSLRDTATTTRRIGDDTAGLFVFKLTEIAKAEMTVADCGLSVEENARLRLTGLKRPDLNHQVSSRVLRFLSSVPPPPPKHYHNVSRQSYLRSYSVVYPIAEVHPLSHHGFPDWRSTIGCERRRPVKLSRFPHSDLSRRLEGQNVETQRQLVRI